MAVKTFTDLTTLPASDINTYLANAGLDYVKEQAVGAGVGSVTVTGAFSATWDHYRVVWAGWTSNQSNIALQLRFANTTGYYANMRFDTWNGTNNTLQTVNQTFAYFGLTGTANNCVVCVDIYNPFRSGFMTSYTGMYVGQDYYGMGGGTYAQTTSQSAITFIQPTGTVSGGTIYVYGYRKA